MSTLCDQIGPFVDGELSPSEAESFRDHLADCAHCQSQLHNLLVLERLGARYMEQRGEEQGARERPTSQVRTTRRQLRRQLVGLSAAACAVAVILALRVWIPNPPKHIAAVVAWKLPGRASTSPRISDPRANSYRPLSEQLMDGSPRRERLPLKELNQLEESGDERGLAAMYLAWDRPDEALAHLEKLDSQDPDVQSNQAAALMGLGKYEEALRLLDSGRTTSPRTPQAQWNRALVLEALHLPLLAARAFQEAAQAKEEGWSQEASQRARELLARSSQEDNRWKGTLGAGKTLMDTGHLPEDALLEDSPLLRLYFYETVRTRKSPEEVRALLPLAKQLDKDVGGAVLQRYVERIAQRDFSLRKPLVLEYIQLLPNFQYNPQTPAFLAKVLRSGEEDLIIGALVGADAVLEHLDKFETSAQASHDPWFEIFALQKRADAFMRGGDLWRAQETLERAGRLCESTPLPYRCLDLELDLAHLHSQLLQPDELRRHALKGWELAQRYNLRGKELQFLEMLAKAARLRDDVTVGRAYLDESLERSRGDKRSELYIYQELAHLALHVLDFDRARTAINQALATGRPLTLHGAAALSDIARQRPNQRDEQTMNEAVAAEGPMASGKRALAHHLLGRFQVEKDRAKGRVQLREAIREADVAGPHDEDARHARTYSYTSLILDDAKAGDFEAALQLFGEELRGVVPRRCVLAFTVDSERSLVVTRGEDGMTRGYYEGERTRRVNTDPPDFVPPAALEAFGPCEKVEVLARPPLQGLSRLLPPTFAWSYRMQLATRRPPSGKSVHLVVEGVEYDRTRGLPPLDWKPEFGPDEQPRRVEGTLATPVRVLHEMEDATEIDLVTHGWLSPVSDASSLILAKESEERGSDELRAQQLRQAKLTGSPLVMIAACHAGHMAPVLHEPVSLPSSLIEAGARAVLAPTISIPDRGASNFFNAIRARIRQGETAAAALRDERLMWHQRSPQDTWVDSILLFE